MLKEVIARREQGIVSCSRVLVKTQDTLDPGYRSPDHMMRTSSISSTYLLWKFTDPSKSIIGIIIITIPWSSKNDRNKCLAVQCTRYPSYSSYFRLRSASVRLRYGRKVGPDHERGQPNRKLTLL